MNVWYTPEEKYPNLQSKGNIDFYYLLVTVHTTLKKQFYKIILNYNFNKII